MSEKINSNVKQPNRNWLTDVVNFAVGLSVNLVSQATDILGGIATEVKSAVFGVVSNSKKGLITSGGELEKDEHANREIFVEKSREEMPGDATISTASSLEFDDFDAKHTHLDEIERERRASSSYENKKRTSTKEDYDAFLKFLQK